MRHTSFSLLALMTVLSCSSAPPLSPPSAAVPQAPEAHTDPSASAQAITPPGLRLPRTALPTRYRPTLTVIPGDPTLRGEIDIDLSLGQPMKVLWLNATDITVERAHVEVSGRQLAARVLPGGEDHLGFAFDTPLPAGSVSLHIAYHGAISSTSDRGVFHEKENGEDYVFTQFENIEARKAFPCFDEPSFKVPWELSVRIRKDDTALSNTKVASEAPLDAAMKLVRFAPTKPLPSYLIAFAVGRFELTGAGTAGKNATPIRIVTPKGKKSEARHAAEVTPALLRLLEDYFGIPYPYDKLDIVAIPQLVSFGAMENPGLITILQKLVLAQERAETVDFKRDYASIMAHEIAHQWFGNLVTLDFWDDVWLNEAFASWAGDKIVAQYKPEWNWGAQTVFSIAGAMHEDSLLSARRIRQPIESKGDIENAFDTITYDKGAAILQMFEAFVSPERFRKGIHEYLSEYAHRNATSRDFLAAISKEAGHDITPAFSSFLDQPGVPVVRGEVVCDKGKPPRVLLTQERYMRIGSSAAPATWQIPLCVRSIAGSTEARSCTLLTANKSEIELGSGSTCPSTLLLKNQGIGYFRAAYAPQALASLVKNDKAIGLLERLALADDVGALLFSGKLPAAQALSFLPDLAAHPDPLVVKSAVLLAFSIPASVLGDELQPRYSRFVQKTFGKKALEMGLLPKKGDDEQTRQLRPLLMALVAIRSDEPKLIADARSLAMRWLDDPTAIAEESVEMVLAIAANHGDRALFDRFYTEAKKENDSRRRSHLIAAMASFRDPAVVKESLAVVLRSDFDPRDATRLLLQDSRVTDSVLVFFRDHFDAILDKLPSTVHDYLPHAFDSYCDGAKRAEVEALFKGRIDKIVGGPRHLAQTLETIDLCSALKAAQRQSLSESLQKY